MRIKIIKKAIMNEFIIKIKLIHNKIKKKLFKKAIFKNIINKVISQLINLVIKTINIYKNLIYKARKINIFQMKLDNPINMKSHTLLIARMINSKDNKLFKTHREVKLILIHLNSHNLKKRETVTLIQTNINTKIEKFKILVNMLKSSNY